MNTNMVSGKDWLFLGHIVTQMAELHVLEIFGVCFLGLPSLELYTMWNSKKGSLLL